MNSEADDRDPTPLQHSDAERVTPEESEKVPNSEAATEAEEDPARHRSGDEPGTTGTPGG